MQGVRILAEYEADGKHHNEPLPADVADEEHALHDAVVEEIVSGGYPTAPRMLVSEAEYWDAAESANPATDTACAATRAPT